jgi:hypothetical protein
MNALRRWSRFVPGALLLLVVGGCGGTTTNTQATTAASTTNATTGPTVGSCAQAWNQGSAPNDRAALVGSAVGSSASLYGSVPVALAVYSGQVERVSSVRQDLSPVYNIVVSPGTCILVDASGYVWVEQPDGEWLLSIAGEKNYEFFDLSVAADPTWTQTHANSTATYGPSGSDPTYKSLGILSADPNAPLVTLTATDVNGQPTPSASPPPTSASSPPTTTTSASQPTSATKQSSGCGILGGYKLTDVRGSLSCLTVTQVAGDYEANKGVLHRGSDEANTYRTFDGWTCYSGTGWGCQRGGDSFTAIQVVP